MAASADGGIYDNEDRGGSDLRRQGAPVQPPLSADVLAPFDRAGGLHARFWLGKARVGIEAHQEYATVTEPDSRSRRTVLTGKHFWRLNVKTVL
jgi:hypothetical protein